MILLDNTVLSNFALIEQISLLEEYCGDKAATTIYVFNEFERGIKEELLPDIVLDWLKKHDLNEKENKSFLNLSEKLGKGEASCLAIAMHRGYDFLSDDMAVRKIALREGIRLSGSIGVLLELIRIRKISLKEGNNILNKFIKYGYYSPVDKLDGLF